MPLCSGLTPLFFSDLSVDHRAAVAVCQMCLLRELCLERALARGEVNGVWGGRIFSDQRKVPPADRVR